MNNKLLFVLGGGIGNIVQATPAIKCAYKHKYKIDLYLTCNSSIDLKIFSINHVNKIYLNPPPLNIKYEYQLQGPFTPNFKSNCKKIIKSKINYAQHIEEAYVYKSLIEQIGIYDNLENVEINFANKGFVPKENTVAIYCGSKPNWAMKRWDKYDELAKHFENVLIVGTKEDIESHGNPAWIKRKWAWPKHVKFTTGKLQEIAFTISKCKMFIGNDGGLSHVAAATGVKTFVLFGPSSFVKNKPFSKNAHAIGIDIPCRPCQFKSINGQQIFRSNESSCPFKMKCMSDMSVNFVLEEIKKYG
jgi:ADP-heptose:LPS heptosyltransferase